MAIALPQRTVIPGFGLTLGITLSYLGLIVIIPLCVLFYKATDAGWVKFFAEPVALMLGKTDCAACEFRRVCLNAGKKLRAKFGPAEGKKKMKALIKRSFTEKPDRLARELKELLET